MFGSSFFDKLIKYGITKVATRSVPIVTKGINNKIKYITLKVKSSVKMDFSKTAYGSLLLQKRSKTISALQI